MFSIKLLKHNEQPVQARTRPNAAAPGFYARVLLLVGIEQRVERGCFATDVHQETILLPLEERGFRDLHSAAS